MSIEILDPTHEGEAQAFSLAQRLDSLEGRTVGLVSNGKEGTRGFFDAFESELVERHGARVVRVTKGNYSAPAEAEIFDRAAEWDALVANSKFKKWPIFAKSKRGHIALQDHGNLVRYRSLRIRRLDPAKGDGGTPRESGK